MGRNKIGFVFPKNIFWPGFHHEGHEEHEGGQTRVCHNRLTLVPISIFHNFKFPTVRRSSGLGVKAETFTVGIFASNLLRVKPGVPGMPGMPGFLC
jgi:hypothetical protein